MRIGMAAAFVLAIGCVQATHAETPRFDLSGTPGAAMVLGIPLNASANLRLRTSLVPSSSGDRTLVRRQSSSMVDFLPGLGGFRISTGLRFDGKRPKGSLGRLSDGAGAGLDIGEGGSRRKQIGGGAGLRPALTMGYGLAASGHTMLGIEAGAIIARNRNPLTLDQTDMVGAARSARRQFTGRGNLDVGQVVRLSLVQGF